MVDIFYQNSLDHTRARIEGKKAKTLGFCVPYIEITAENGFK